MSQINPPSNHHAALEKRRLGWTAAAALSACAICCAVPVLAVSGISGAALSTIAHVFHPKTETIAGVGVAAVVLAFVGVRRRLTGARCSVTSCTAGGRSCRSE
jgi:hypothetical protein